MVDQSNGFLRIGYFDTFPYIPYHYRKSNFPLSVVQMPTQYPFATQLH